LKISAALIATTTTAIAPAIQRPRWATVCGWGSVVVAIDTHPFQKTAGNSHALRGTEHDFIVIAKPFALRLAVAIDALARAGAEVVRVESLRRLRSIKSYIRPTGVWPRTLRCV